MKHRKRKEPPSFEVIEAAISGDVESINEILLYFRPYIEYKSKRKFINEFGRVQYVTDEYMKLRLENKLIQKILDFKIRVE